MEIKITEEDCISERLVDTTIWSETYILLREDNQKFRINIETKFDGHNRTRNASVAWLGYNCACSKREENISWSFPKDTKEDIISDLSLFDLSEHKRKYTERAISLFEKNRLKRTEWEEFIKKYPQCANTAPCDCVLQHPSYYWKTYKPYK